MCACVRLCLRVSMCAKYLTAKQKGRCIGVPLSRTQKLNRIQEKKNVCCHCTGTPVFSVHESSLHPFITHSYTRPRTHSTKSFARENFHMKNVCSCCKWNIGVCCSYFHCEKTTKKWTHPHTYNYNSCFLGVWTENFTEWRTWTCAHIILLRTPYYERQYISADGTLSSTRAQMPKLENSLYSIYINSMCS